MTKYPDTEKTGDIGVDILSLKVKRELSWIFREQAKSDLGIDGQIEIVNENKEGTGRLIAVQLKTGKSYLKYETTESYTYYGKNDHLNYWINHSLPVIVVLCDDIEDVCYWVEITRANIKRTTSAWNVLVPKKQTISKSYANDFISIAGAPAHPDIVELALYKFIGEKYHSHSSEGRLDICPLIDTPRDFYGFPYLARFDKTNELTFIAHHFDIYRDFKSSDIDEYLLLREENTSSWALSEKTHKLIIFVISEDVEKLKSYKDITKSYQNLDNVEIYRLVYRYDYLLSGELSKFYELIELDTDDNEIYIY
jgi:hypothetical protein